MSLTKFKKPGADFLRSVECSLPTFSRHIDCNSFREIVGILCCSHFLNGHAILNEFLKLQKYISNVNCDSLDPALAIDLWLTYCYKRLCQSKDILLDYLRVPHHVKRKLEHIYDSLNLENVIQKYCPSVNAGQIDSDQIALLPFSEELWFDIQNGATNHSKIFSVHRKQTEEMKDFILFQCMIKLDVAKPLATTNIYRLKMHQPLTGVAFSKCRCKINRTKNEMLMTVSDDNVCKVSSLTDCNEPCFVKCYESFKMDFETRGCSVSTRCNEGRKLESKFLSSPVKMNTKSNKNVSPNYSASVSLCNSTCVDLSDFIHASCNKSVAAEITYPSAEATELNGKDRSSPNSSESSISLDIAPAPIISHGASQIRKFLSTTLSSSCSDDSVSETSEFDSEYMDEEMDSNEESVNGALFAGKFFHNVSNSFADESIVLETDEWDDEQTDKISCDYEDIAYEMTDSVLDNASNNVKFDYTLAMNKHCSTLNWVKTFYTSTVESNDVDLDSVSEEPFNDFEYCSNSDVESSLLDENFNDTFVRSPSQQHTKYYNFNRAISPLRKCNEFKGNEDVQDVDDLDRVCKVTFAPDESLVTVHVFEREPEELLPDLYELDRIRFQMRIHSVGLLLKPFLTNEHRAKILERM